MCTKNVHINSIVRLLMKILPLLSLWIVLNGCASQQVLCELREDDTFELYSPSKQLIDELINSTDLSNVQYLSENLNLAQWKKSTENRITACIPDASNDRVDSCGQIIYLFEKDGNDWEWRYSEITTCHQTI